MKERPLDELIEERIEELGYECVELERAGSKSRPILRVRIDRPSSGAEAIVDDSDAERHSGITVEDCTRVSRALETFLDERVDLSERYVLEVSSPGVERPLVRRRDYERFAGKEIVVRAAIPLHGDRKRIEGELLGIEGDGAAERVRLRLADGSQIDIPRADIARAHLIFRWDDRR